MKVLVIGQGGREHALAWKLAQSPAVQEIFTAPGNAGTALAGTNIDLPVTASEELADWAADAVIDLTVVGPEAALAAGVVDAFRTRGLRVFGPTRAAARLETSKAWAKDFMVRRHIPTARHREFEQTGEANAYLHSLGSEEYPVVIKVDGLASGKGVTIAADQRTALDAVQAGLGEPGGAARIVIEQFLRGFEVSFLAISDGRHARPLACAHDYKHAHDGDQGPMTGGMGAYSPLGIEDRLTDEVMATVINPAIQGMAAEGTPYEGILYAGLMLTAEGPIVLEFNARFGDPETQVLLPRWKDDMYAVLVAATAGRLPDLPPFSWDAAATCGVVLASAGYPGAPVIGLPIEGLSPSAPEVLIFHGGTRRNPRTNDVCSSGGRVLTVVGRGATVAEARTIAYERAGHIRFEGCWRRNDIGSEEPGTSNGLAADAS